VNADAIATALDEARRRSLSLLAPLPDDRLVTQHSPLMSPLVWDLAHVANYEDLWLVRAITGEPTPHPELDDLYDAFRHPRADRPSLPILGPAEARAYGAEVRGRVLDLVERLRFDDPADPLLGDGFVHQMVVQHEHQHDETMLATLQLMATPGYRPLAVPGPAPVPGSALAAEVRLPGGAFVMGTSSDPWALDNERPAHEVDLPPFWLDTTPVTNAGYAGFVADGGYADRRWWSDEGWDWRESAGLRHPQFWSRHGSGWTRDRFGHDAELDPDEPVQHVCWYEADACARWMGKRLPSEAEWEYAASWGPDGRKRRWPWGDVDPSPAHATLWFGESSFGPAPATAHPAGANPWGVLGLIGDVWEWTASDFAGHPGFGAHPYREYSEVFFGPRYKVLRGGSWGTHPSCIRPTFRNWDYPIRRQIFAGFRCARDA
jgi:gamma-glutamyl hercynylcysteine S-oxide synthase